MISALQSMLVSIRPFLILLLLVPPLISAQSGKPCACCSEEFRQFDFWLGNWEVRDTNGVVLGHNSIELLEDGCILSEHWTGAKGSSGRSYNYYNSTDSSWNQVWISNNGYVLELKGKGQAGTMALTSELQNSPNGNIYNRITWTENEDGTVTQRWDILNEKKMVLSTIFYGIYIKK